MDQQDEKVEEVAQENVEQSRIVMLSDGVFAIAMTLLVFDVRVPDGVDTTSVKSIISVLLPHLIGYAISFVVIASYWFGHRVTMRAVTNVNNTFIWLNFIFLFFIAIFPVPTDLLGRHFGSVVPTIIYACFSAITGLSLWLLWVYASGEAKLLHPRFNTREVRYHNVFYLLRSVVYLLSMFIIFVPNGAYIFFVIWAVGVRLLAFILKKILLPHIKAKKQAVAG
jgi:uncharacterized membrane protein